MYCEHFMALWQIIPKNCCEIRSIWMRKRSTTLHNIVVCLQSHETVAYPRKFIYCQRVFLMRYQSLSHLILLLILLSSWPLLIVLCLVWSAIWIFQLLTTYAIFLCSLWVILKMLSWLCMAFTLVWRLEFAIIVAFCCIFIDAEYCCGLKSNCLSCWHFAWSTVFAILARYADLLLLSWLLADLMQLTMQSRVQIWFFGAGWFGGQLGTNRRENRVIRSKFGLPTSSSGQIQMNYVHTHWCAIV